MSSLFILLAFVCSLLCIWRKIAAVFSEGFVLRNLPLWLNELHTPKADIQWCVLSEVREAWLVFVGWAEVQRDTHLGCGGFFFHQSRDEIITLAGVLTVSVLLCTKLNQL